MTKTQIAKYNRLSTKCHAYVRHYLPEIHAKLAQQVESEWEHHRCRRTAKIDLQRALNPKNLADDVSVIPTQESRACDEWGEAFYKVEALELKPENQL